LLLQGIIRSQHRLDRVNLNADATDGYVKMKECIDKSLRYAPQFFNAFVVLHMLVFTAFLSDAFLIS